MPYRLTREAEADVIEIAKRGLDRWGPGQAQIYHNGLFELFDLIASTPAMARQRTELTPPVRVQRYKAHLVIYLIDDEGVLIVRVRHGREDWQEDL